MSGQFGNWPHHSIESSLERIQKEADAKDAKNRAVAQQQVLDQNDMDRQNRESEAVNNLRTVINGKDVDPMLKQSALKSLRKMGYKE